MFRSTSRHIVVAVSRVYLPDLPVRKQSGLSLDSLRHISKLAELGNAQKLARSQQYTCGEKDCEDPLGLSNEGTAFRTL